MAFRHQNWAGSGALAVSLALGACGCLGSVDDGAGGGPGGVGPGGHPTAQDPAPGTVVAAVAVRRLSQAELDNTLEDILGDTTRPADRLLLEDEFRPYDNDYNLQRASPAYTDSVRELARDVARRAVATPQARMAFMPCAPTGAGDAACLRQTIEAVGRRLLRRPLNAAEVDGYARFGKFATEVNATVKPDFFTAIDLVLRAMVQDPEFLHRVEIGRTTPTPGVVALDSYAVASRMSYLVWGSAPDVALLDAAARDALLTTAGRGAELDRMLRSKRARTQLHRFHAQWLGYRTIPHTAEMTGLFSDETTKLLDTVIFDSPSSYLDVFSSPRTWVTTKLAAHYGLPAPAGGAGWVNYDGKGRAGILAHGAVLAAFSKFSDTSPTQRGIFVQTRLLCNLITSPPANVDVDQPPGNPDQDCKTDRYLAHMGQSGCKTCHSLIDPIGLGLENFDIGGRWRDTDDGKPQCRIPGQGDIGALGTFTGPKDLAAKLIAAGEIQDCLVRQYLTFSLGRPLDSAEDPVIGGLAKALGADGNKLVAMVRHMVTEPAFALRKEAP